MPRFSEAELFKMLAEECIGYAQTRPIGVIVTNSKWVIKYINPEAYTMFGYRLTELLLQPLTVLIAPGQKHPHHHDADVGAKELLARDYGQPHQIVDGITKDGKIIKLKVTRGETYSTARGDHRLTALIERVGESDTGQYKRLNEADLKGYSHE